MAPVTWFLSQVGILSVALPWLTQARDVEDPSAEKCFLHAGRSESFGTFTYTYVGNNSLDTPVVEAPLTFYVETQINSFLVGASRKFYLFSPDKSLTIERPEELDFHGCTIYFRNATNAGNILPRPDEGDDPPDLRCGDAIGDECVRDVNDIARDALNRIVRDREEGNATFSPDEYTCDLVVDAIERSEVPSSCDFPLWTPDPLDNRTAFVAYNLAGRRPNANYTAPDKLSRDECFRLTAEEGNEYRLNPWPMMGPNTELPVDGVGPYSFEEQEEWANGTSILMTLFWNEDGTNLEALRNGPDVSMTCLMGVNTSASGATLTGAASLAASGNIASLLIAIMASVIIGSLGL